MDLPETHRRLLEALFRKPLDLDGIDPDALEELRSWGNDVVHTRGDDR
jgi:hypothetical protein